MLGGLQAGQLLPDFGILFFEGSDSVEERFDGELYFVVDVFLHSTN